MDILTIIRVFMASTDIYCSRRQNQWGDPHPLADSLSAISTTTIYHNFPSKWQLFSRPKALWNIPAPPFSLGMDSSSWCQGKDTDPCRNGPPPRTGFVYQKCHINKRNQLIWAPAQDCMTTLSFGSISEVILSEGSVETHQPRSGMEGT